MMNAKQINDLCEQLRKQYPSEDFADNPKLSEEYSRKLNELIDPLDREDQRAVMRRLLEMNNNGLRESVETMRDFIDEAPPMSLEMMRLNESMEKAMRAVDAAVQLTDEALERK